MKRTPLGLLAAGLLAAGLAACSPSSAELPGGLQWEEHPLAAAPGLDPLSFQPMQGNRDEILSRHVGDREARFSSEVVTVEGNPVMQSLGESDDLVAQLITSSQDPPQQTVNVLRGTEIIFTADAGLPSPALPQQGLWTYDGHWALELLYTDPDTWIGQVYVDGELVNAVEGYDEAFGFQLLDGEPFHFFVRNGRAGIWYDGQEADLGYGEVIHYRCCAESTLNPIQAVNMVAFYASRDGTWHYVEIGRFGS